MSQLSFLYTIDEGLFSYKVVCNINPHGKVVKIIRIWKWTPFAYVFAQLICESLQKKKHLDLLNQPKEKFNEHSALSQYFRF